MLYQKQAKHNSGLVFHRLPTALSIICNVHAQSISRLIAI
jgi:hypothetical protein